MEDVKKVCVGGLACFLFLQGCTGSAHAETKSATVYFFIMTDCPIANSYAPEIKRIISEYGAFSFTVVYVDKDAAAARVHADEYGYSRWTVDYELAKKLRIAKVPEVAVIFNNVVVYRGRIDDMYVDLGKRRAEATTRDLRDALDCIAAGKQVAVRETQAVGCDIQ